MASLRPKIMGLVEMLVLQDRLKLAENLEQAKAELAAGGCGNSRERRE